MDGLLTDTLPWLLVGLMAVGALLMLRQPIRYAGRLCLRTLVSLGALAAFHPLGAALGNALVMGLLGAPGFGLLLLLNWALAL